MFTFEINGDILQELKVEKEMRRNPHLEHDKYLIIGLRNKFYGNYLLPGQLIVENI